MKKTLICIGLASLAFVACTSQGYTEDGNKEVVIRESDLQSGKQQTVEVIDSLFQGPFYKYAIYRKMDDNGGYEEYRLIMNLYEPNIPDEDGSLSHGRVSLYVKTPENTEGIKIAERTIQRVESVEGFKAKIEMASVGEKPIYFDGVITYDTVSHTYELDMAAPAQLEDLIVNHLVLQ